MSQQQSRHKLRGGDHYWGDPDTLPTPQARWHEPGSGVTWLLLPVFMLLLLVCWWSTRSTKSPSLPQAAAPAAMSPPAQVQPVAAPQAQYNIQVRSAVPQGMYFYYDLANENGAATLDTDQAKIIFRGAAYGNGCGHDTDSLPLYGRSKLESGPSSNPSYRLIAVEDGNVTVIFAGHKLVFTNRLTQLQVDQQVFDVSRTKPTLAIEPDGTITRLDQLTIPLPTPHPHFISIIYVDNSCR